MSRENSTSKILHDLCFFVDWPCIEWPCVRWPCATWPCVYWLTLKLAVIPDVRSDHLGQSHSHCHCLRRQLQGMFVNPFISVSYFFYVSVSYQDLCSHVCALLGSEFTCLCLIRVWVHVSACSWDLCSSVCVLCFIMIWVHVSVSYNVLWFEFMCLCLIMY